MNKERLLDAIQKVNPAVSGAGLIEQSNLILFNRKEVISYNEEILIIAPIESEIEGTVPAKELHDLLQKMKDKKVTVEQKNDKLEVVGKSTKARLKVSDVNFPKADLPDKWKALPEDFVKGIRYCRYSVAEEGNVLSNIYLYDDKVISCDNYRITEYTMEKKMFRKSCLLPSSSVYILIPFLPVFFSSDKSWLFFKNEDGAVLCIRKVDQGEYPDVQSKLDEKLKGVRIKLPDELKDSLQRTRILSDEDLVTGNRMVNIVIKDEKMFCHGECNVGQIDETINIDYNGERLSFDIVSDFLFEILGKTKTMTVGDESLRFKTKTLQHIIQLAYETEGKE